MENVNLALMDICLYVMRLIILKTENIQSACDRQDEECQGVNCKNCQFNKIGIDVEFFKKQLYTSIFDFLNKDKGDIYNKTNSLIEIFIQLLLKEESEQFQIGSKIFKKIIK